MCAWIQPVLRDTGYVNGNVAVLMGMGCVNGNKAMSMRIWLC